MKSKRLLRGALISAVLAAGLVSCALFVGPSHEQLSEIRETLASEHVMLLDVRSPEEFSEGHLQDAVNIPVDEVEGRLDEIGAKDRPLVVYCRSGFRSSRAADTLREAGYQDVHDLGGIGNGEEVGLETR